MNIHIFAKMVKRIKWIAWFIIMIAALLILMTQPFEYSEWVGLVMLLLGFGGALRALAVGFFNKLGG